MKILIFILVSVIFFLKPFPVQAALTVDIVNASYVSVTSPTVAMVGVPFSYTCQTATGTLGTATEQIYVNNPNDAKNGWTATIAASATTAVWDNATTPDADYDFNDPTASGCTDSADADAFGGQMTINPAAGAVDHGADDTTDITTGISKGTSTAFIEGTTDSITLISADETSDEDGNWTLQGISISQKVPAEQAVGSYSITLVITISAVP